MTLTKSCDIKIWNWIGYQENSERERNNTTNRNQSKENKTGYSVKSNELNIIILQNDC